MSDKSPAYVFDSLPPGGYAFPSEVATVKLLGMTLRDYFAGQAFAECLRIADHPTSDDADLRLSTLLDKASKYAYYAADAMLKARDA